MQPVPGHRPPTGRERWGMSGPYWPAQAEKAFLHGVAEHCLDADLLLGRDVLRLGDLGMVIILRHYFLVRTRFAIAILGRN